MATKYLPEAHSRTFSEATPSRPLGLGTGRFSMPENVDQLGAEVIEELFLGFQH